MKIPTNQIITGDCLEVMQGWPDKSIHCCITSPPYFGLRDYGTATWEGRDAECDHKVPDEAGKTDKPTEGQREHAGRFAGPTYHKCGAKRHDQQLGLEKDPETYVAKMVEVFREVKRILRDDGTLWLNLGDTYWGGKGQSGSGGKEYQQLRSEDGVSFSSPEAHVGGRGKTKPIHEERDGQIQNSEQDADTSANCRNTVGTQVDKQRMRASCEREPGRQPTGKLASSNKNSTCPDTHEPSAYHELKPYSPVPCIVADIFMGAGTVGVVAVKHGRDYVGSELNPEYIKIAERRIAAVVTGVPVEEANNGQGALWE